MRFRSAFSKKHLLGLFLAMSVVSALAGQRVARPMRNATSFVLAPLGDGPMYAVTELGRKLSNDPGGHISPEEARKLEEDNKFLTRLVAQWQSACEVYHRQAEELANFQRMYGPAKDLACELIPAHVVAAGSLPYGQSRLLNAGTNRGIRPGSPVTTRELLTQRSKALPPPLAAVESNALVGWITDSGAFTARLQLLSDPGFQLRGQIRRVISLQRPRIITVTEGDSPRRAALSPDNNLPIEVLAVGDGTKRLVIRDVKEYHSILPGDLLTTDARRVGLPAEIHVGKVVEVVRDTTDARRVSVYVEPHADLENLRDVFILSPLRPPPAKP